MTGILTPIFFCTSVGIVLFVLAKTLLPFLRGAMLHKHLMRTGTEADATILAVSQTGLYVNNMPQVRLELQVQPLAGRRSFVAEVQQVLDFVQIPNFQSGRSVKVKYNPANTKQVALLGTLCTVTMMLMMSSAASAQSPTFYVTDRHVVRNDTTYFDNAYVAVLPN